MRGDRTFAYDLDMAHGAVNSRVVLLLRSIEAKPRRFSPVLKNTPHPFNCRLIVSVKGISVIYKQRGF
jgi:hypothetical protein